MGRGLFVCIFFSRGALALPPDANLFDKIGDEGGGGDILHLISE